MRPSQEEDERLARQVEQLLARELFSPADGRRWWVSRGQALSDFVQYRHLRELEARVAADESGTLESVFGERFRVVPDVTVSVESHEGTRFLHAAIACKWGLRPDCVEEIRHQSAVLIRHRRGRQPHIVTVTAEPLPSRLAAIAKGTGEVDGVYHVAFDELVNATDLQEDLDQRRILDVLIAQERLMRFEELVGTLLL